ncbi:MAG TPA: PQQ-binding-like beta-propeller repeat protein [Candidatus Dormibacteraeota bacterium]|nr:PQQ-binding-like beta-propeller repeat protein [Candidatus Dormibacteraeota bacterium]
MSRRSPTVPSAPISSDWIEYHRDAARSGLGPSDPALSNPAVAWTFGLDADVYASPLIVAGHVIAATENNTVYSLDVFTGSVIWKVHLGDPVQASSLPCGDIGPITGITGTPAVDPSTGRLYVVAYLRNHQHVLFALSLVDGGLVFQQDVDPVGSTPSAQQERGALAIGSGRVYVPLGGLFGDCSSYHGYVVAVPVGGGPATAYRVPSSRGAGIWTPAGPVIDPEGNVYVATGNGESRSNFDGSNAVVELSPDLQTVKSYFAPSNWVELNLTDRDLGALGPTLVQGAALAVGKDGIAYLLNASQLGGIGGQVASRRLCGGAFGGTAQDKGVVFVPCTDGLYAVAITSNSMSVRWHAQQPATASPIVAAGVVWAIESSSGRLYALDESNGSVRYSTNLGPAMHFSTPAATDGFVIVPAGRQVIGISVVS